MVENAFVVLGRLAHYPTLQLARLHFPHLDTPVTPSPDELGVDEARCCELVVRGSKALRGTTRLRKLTQLEAGSAAQWVIRRAAAEALAALLPAGHLRVIPAPLVDETGVLDADWALLDVQARVPLDRDAARFVPTTPGAPHASLIARVEHLAWSPDRLPNAPLFRVAEAPELLVAKPEIALWFSKYVGPWVVPLAPPYDAPTHDGRPCGKLHGIGGLHREPVGSGPAFPIDEAAGSAAFAAYYRLAAGLGNSSDRRDACQNPVTAYYLARFVDGGPRDDTRAGAITHPRYATLYARDIDRGPRDDTRAAAATERFSAFVYLEWVDRTCHPDLVAVIGEANAQSRLQQSSVMRAARVPPPDRFPAAWRVHES